MGGRFYGGLALGLIAGFGCQGKLLESNAYPGPEDRANPRHENMLPPPPASLMSLELTSVVSTLVVGQRTVFTLAGRSDDGTSTFGFAADWTSSNDAVLRVEADGTVEAVGEGSAEIQASVKDIVSNPVSLRVLARRTGGEASVRIVSDRLVIAPGDQDVAQVQARNAAGDLVSAPEVTWTTGDPAVATVSPQGVVSAVAAGTTWLRARFDGTDSATVDVHVGTEGDFLAVDFELPDADVAASQQVQVVGLVQTLRLESTSQLGIPVLANSAEVLVDDAPAGTLQVEFGRVMGTVSIADLTEGAHELRLRVTRDGQTAVSPALALMVEPAGELGWQALGINSAPMTDDAVLTEAGGALYVAGTRCRRFCGLEVHRYDEADDGWTRLEYRAETWRDWDNSRESREETLSNVNLPRFVGWGSTGANARAPDFAPYMSTPVVAWANDDSRRGFNEEDMPERYWFDCYAATWDSAGGHDGAGGWRLLSEEQPDFLWNPPSPSELEARYGAWEQARFPPGADKERTLDCDYPQVVSRGSDVLMAYLSSPRPNNAWQLELRTWQNGGWTDAASALPVLGNSPVLETLVLDGQDRPLATVVVDGMSRVYRHDGGWRAIGGESAPSVEALNVTATGTLWGAGIESGDGRVYVGSETQWVPMGERLNVLPFSTVWQMTVASAGDDLFVAWTEGPQLGDRNLYVARWDAAQAGWMRLTTGPAEVEPDRAAYDPKLFVRENGTLLLLYSQPTDNPDDPWGQRVLARPLSGN